MRALLTNCFAAGTPIQWEHGSKPIEQFVPGERVWARADHDPQGPLELKAIEECFVAEAALWHVHVGGQIIRTTDGHPFWVLGKGWTGAKALQAGDRLVGRNGSETAVEEVYETIREYNLALEDALRAAVKSTVKSLIFSGKLADSNELMVVFSILMFRMYPVHEYLRNFNEGKLCNEVAFEPFGGVRLVHDGWRTRLRPSHSSCILMEGSYEDLQFEKAN